MQDALKPRLVKVTRIAAKISIGLIAFLVLLLLALFLLNSFDARLSEQAKALLTAPPNPYPSDQNIYLAMAGLEGPGERPIIEMGQERIETYNRALDSPLSSLETASALNEKWDAAKLTFGGEMALGPQRTTSIWTEVKNHRQDIATLLKRNQQLYQRYLSLHHLHGYYETARPSYMAPSVYAPQMLRILFLADVANRIQSGTLQQQREALTDLRQDLQLWRTILKGDGTLISKMVAVAWIHADLILAADLITDPSTDLAHLEDILDLMLSPFDLQDYRIGNAFAVEFRGTAALYKTIALPSFYVADSKAPISWRQRVSNAFQAHFFKLNATENMGAALAAQASALADSEPSQFFQNRDAYHVWLKVNEPHPSLKFLYNPIGKTLVRIALAQNDIYPMRAFDVAAYQRLVYLAYQIRRQHIATPDVASFLIAHPDWSTHPLDAKPFRWNVETCELAVNTLADHPKEQRYNMVLR
jgi:hypothetical protein